MKVKRFIAENSQEAIFKIKTELGRDAIILHSRKIKRPGIFSFLKKPLIEMVAAVEQEQTDKKPQNNLSNSNNMAYKVSPLETGKIQKLQEQIENIESMLNRFMSKAIKTPEDSLEKNQSEIFEKYYNLLLENDVDESIAGKVMNIVGKQFSFSTENEGAIKKGIKILIKEYLGSPSPVDENTKTNKIIFIGPTGVGKTTTIAKLAAKFSIRAGKSVGLITADTYRIAAVEQLRTYSKILDIPVKIIYEPKEITDAIKNYKDKDMILVDTAGRNHKVQGQLNEVKEIVSYVQEADVFLVISATTAYKDIVDIIQSYEFLNNYKLLFTKLDETTTVGNILNIKALTGKPLSYFTTGQSVPDDIEIASAEKIANIIVGE